MTIAPNSIIHTLRGDMLAIDLIGHSDPPYIYTWDGNRVTIGKILFESSKIRVPMKLELDNGDELWVTDDSKTIRLDGTPLQIKDLVSMESLLPLYFKISDEGYPMYREPGNWHKGGLTTKDKWPWRKISRMVAEAKLNRRVTEQDKVWMADGNKFNCHPNNIDVQHLKPKKRQWKSKLEPFIEADEIIEGVRRKLPKKKKKKINHKVINSKFDNSREMLSIRGVGTANFGVNGIFIAVDVG